MLSQGKYVSQRDDAGGPKESDDDVSDGGRCWRRGPISLSSHTEQRAADVGGGGFAPDVCHPVQRPSGAHTAGGGRGSRPGPGPLPPHLHAQPLLCRELRAQVRPRAGPPAPSGDDGCPGHRGGRGAELQLRAPVPEHRRQTDTAAGGIRVRLHLSAMPL